MELNSKNYESIILLGDTHGEYGHLFRALDNNSITNCLLIMVGDGGEGFIKPERAQVDYFKKLNEEFKKRNIEYVAIRGNHSDPFWFTGNIWYPNFKLIPDYSYFEINEELWQFVGGAISVDRKYRIAGRDYWKNEKFNFEPDKATKCDVLITHTAPQWIGPTCKGGFVQPFIDKDLHLYEELTTERKEVQKLFDVCQPKKAFFGHFHTSETTFYENQQYSCLGRILNILELLEYRK